MRTGRSLFFLDALKRVEAAAIGRSLRSLLRALVGHHLGFSRSPPPARRVLLHSGVARATQQDAHWSRSALRFRKHRCLSHPRSQRPTQPPTGGGLSWWLWPLRGGHGRGPRRFAAVMAEVFAAPSWWSRRRSFFHRHKNNAKNRFTYDSRLFLSQEPARGLRLFAALAPPGEIFGEIVEKEEKNKPKKTTITGRGRWSCGGLRRAALEGTAVFCGHGRWFILEVFLGFSKFGR